jgi:hypothetical protein
MSELPNKDEMLFVSRIPGNGGKRKVYNPSNYITFTTVHVRLLSERETIEIQAKLVPMTHLTLASC